MVARKTIILNLSGNPSEYEIKLFKKNVLAFVKDRNRMFDVYANLAKKKPPTKIRVSTNI